MLEKIKKQIEQAKKELELLKKANADADEISFIEEEIDELEEKLKSSKGDEKKEPEKKAPLKKVDKVIKPSTKTMRSKLGRKKVKSTPKVEKPVQKPEEKKLVKRVVKTPPSTKTKKVEPKKKILPVRRSRGLSIEYKGKTYQDTDPEFCNILIKQLEERREKRLAAKGKVKKVSLSSKVGDNISSSVVSAIKGAFNENKEEILENKTAANKFLKAIVRIEAAADKFVKEMKVILNENFKQRDFDKEFKDVDELVKKIKETIKKSIS